MRYYITTKQNTPLIHHIICAENIGMDPVVPCLFDDFFAAFLTKSGKSKAAREGGLFLCLSPMIHHLASRLFLQAVLCIS